MPRNRKNRNRKGKSRRSGPTLNRASMRMAGTGSLASPLAVDYKRPTVKEMTKTPTRKGAESAVNGCDFVGTYSSLAASARTIEFDLNALNALVFPRLAATASIWKRYVFDYLIFHIFGITGATQEGFGAMASIVTDDLATEVTVGGEVDVLNMEGAAIVRPWSATSHRVRCEAEGLKWYTSDNSASSSSYGEAIGRSFLYIPATPAGDGKISFQIYVEYGVQFSQRVPYKLDPPVSVVMTADSIEELHAVRTSESFFNDADEDVAEALTESLITNREVVDIAYGRAFIGSVGRVAQAHWETILNRDESNTLADVIHFMDNIGSWWGTNDYGSGHEILKMFPFFLEFILGREDNFPATSWTNWMAKITIPLFDAVSAQGLTLATLQTALKTAVDNYVPSPERLNRLLEPEIDFHGSDRFQKVRKRLRDNLVSDSKMTESCRHPPMIEGTKICCTLCV